MSGMRKLVIGLVVLLIAAVAADFVAARVFESRVAEELGRRYEIQGRPIVQVRDFPFLPHLVTGHISTVDLAARNVRDRGTTIARVEVHLHDLTIPRSVMLGHSGQVRVGRADGEATVGAAELNRLVADRLQGGTLEVTEDGVRLGVRTTVLGRPVDATLSGRLTAAGGRVVLVPTDVEVESDTGAALPRAVRDALLRRFGFPIPLPRLPAGIQVERIVTQPGFLVVAGQATAIRLPT
jgi:LmeA-like phospholipid-binding